MHSPFSKIDGTLLASHEGVAQSNLRRFQMNKMCFGLTAFLLVLSLAAFDGVAPVFSQAKKTQDSSKPDIQSGKFLHCVKPQAPRASFGQSMFWNCLLCAWRTKNSGFCGTHTKHQSW